MNEIKEVIILAAGSSKRMGDLTKDKPKSLLPYKDETILGRLIRQLRENNIEKIIIVVGYKKEQIAELVESIEGIEIEIIENNLYTLDMNIYSMKLASEVIFRPFVIFEADTIMEKVLVQYVTGSDFEGTSVWFTQDNFKEGQYGGILKSDKYGQIIDIEIVPKYDTQYDNYKKLTGLMRVGPNELEKFKKLIDKYAKRSIEQYYLIPWIENLADLPCIEGNAEHYAFKTFNKPEEYLQIKNSDFDQENEIVKEVEFVEVDKLKHIEGFDEERIKKLMKKIIEENIWNKPLFIEKTHNLVLDGQHRLQVALRLGLKYVPIQRFHYNEVKVWTLRKEEKVDIDTVIKRANEEDTYPYKTVKHKFPYITSKCEIKLSDLK